MFSMTAALLVAAGVVSGAAAEEIKLLNIGDPAPEFKVSKWIKGEPLEGLPKGRLCVIEFWATWCGPCKQVIPHVTELANKYKDKVTFVGVSVFERQDEKDSEEETLDKIEKFVTRMGEKMGYRVAADGKSNYMVKNWIEPASEESIPLTFVVGEDGKIAWIGSPFALEKVLAEIVKGTYDVASRAAERRKEKLPGLRDRKVAETIGEFLKQNKFKEAVAAIDKAMDDYPDYRKSSKMAFTRFALLLKADEDKAYTYGRELAEGDFNANPELLFQVARYVVENRELQKPDFKLAVSCAQKANHLTSGRSPIVGATLAAAHFRNGDPGKAVAAMEKAVEEAEDDTKFPEAGRRILRQQLEEYKQAAKKPAKRQQ